MNFFIEFLKQNAGVLGGHEGHTLKGCCPLRFTPYIAEIRKKSYAFTFVYQLCCCSSKHNNNKALRITFNSCNIVSTSSMALATVNIDKIIKVTSASSYVLPAFFNHQRAGQQFHVG